MALRQRKPTSPGRRFQTVSDFADITKTLPEKSLLDSKPKTGGRNNYGRKTSRHRGGGHKQQYRIIDFKRNKDAIPARVAAIEYDPNRTCRIALLHYLDGEKRYILAPNGLKVDDMVESGPKADIRTGAAAIRPLSVLARSPQPGMKVRTSAKALTSRSGSLLGIQPRMSRTSPCLAAAWLSSRDTARGAPKPSPSAIVIPGQTSPLSTVMR